MESLNPIRHSIANDPNLFISLLRQHLKSNFKIDDGGNLEFIFTYKDYIIFDGMYFPTDCKDLFQLECHKHASKYVYFTPFIYRYFERLDEFWEKFTLLFGGYDHVGLNVRRVIKRSSRKNSIQ